MIGALAKASGPGTGSGLFFQSNDAAVNRLDGWASLMVDPTPANRRLALGCVENGIAWRNVTICEQAGNVGIGLANPTVPLQIKTATDLHLGIQSISGFVSLVAQNDAGSAYVPMRLFSSNITLSAPVTVGGSLNATSVYSSVSLTAGTYYFGSNGAAYLNYNGAQFAFAGGPVGAVPGLLCQPGAGGAFRGSNVTFSIDYNGGSPVNLYIGSTNMGVITITSDYRIKKNVLDLPGMWDTVKALRPIKYTQAQFSPPSHIAYTTKLVKQAREQYQQAVEHGDATLPPEPPKNGIIKPMFEADNIERWGFIAHELQETLVPSAVDGRKDSPDTLQSPNMLPLVAALTKALQEAMTRIEALEAR